MSQYSPPWKLLPKRPHPLPIDRVADLNRDIVVLRTQDRLTESEWARVTALLKGDEEMVDLAETIIEHKIGELTRECLGIKKRGKWI
jgi:hypothetical protein